VANDICRSAVPAPKYLPERRSTAFPHHYTPADRPSASRGSICDQWRRQDFVTGGK